MNALYNKKNKSNLINDISGRISIEDITGTIAATNVFGLAAYNQEDRFIN